MCIHRLTSLTLKRELTPALRELQFGKPCNRGSAEYRNIIGIPKAATECSPLQCHRHADTPGGTRKENSTRTVKRRHWTLSVLSSINIMEQGRRRCKWGSFIKRDRKGDETELLPCDNFTHLFKTYQKCKMGPTDDFHERKINQVPKNWQKKCTTLTN